MALGVLLGGEQALNGTDTLDERRVRVVAERDQQRRDVNPPFAHSGAGMGRKRAGVTCQNRISKRKTDYGETDRVL